MPSMKLREKELCPWVIIDSVELLIKYAHYSCKAGLGETCTHVAAIPFSVMFASMKKESNVTDEFVYWVLPKKSSKQLPRFQHSSSNKNIVDFRHQERRNKAAYLKPIVLEFSLKNIVNK